MTEEKIKQGEELLNRLRRLKDQKEKWERGVRFSRVELVGDKEYLNIDSSFINFDEVKLLAIAKIDKRISEVQEEFDKL